MPRRRTFELAEIDVSPRPFSCMPDQVTIIEDMNLYPYELLAKAASSPEEARTSMLKTAITATNGRKPEAQVDYVEAFLPVIEKRITDSFPAASTHLAVRASRAIERELRKPKSKRKERLKFPVYKFVEFHGGSGPLMRDTQNCYLMHNNKHMQYLLASLKEMFGAKICPTFNTLPYTETVDGETYKTKQVCLDVVIIG